MKRAGLTCIALIGLTAVCGLAAERGGRVQADADVGPVPQVGAEPAEPVIPERKLTFEVSEEEEPMPFTVADPKLLEQRYVARFRLVGMRPMRIVNLGLGDEPARGYGAAMRRLQYWLGNRPRVDAAVLKPLLSEMPQERLPSEEVKSLLARMGSQYFSVHIVPSEETVVRPDGRVSRDDSANVDVTILAPTAENAKQLVEGVLAFYDYGVFYPLQKEILAIRRDYQQRLPEARAELEKAQENYAALGKQLEGLKEYRDVGEEALVDFTTQLRLISVEMRGVEARIGACNKMLGGGTGRRLSEGLVERLETLKIGAEIELVGLAARREAIEEIVKKGEELKKVSAERDRARTLATGARNRVEKTAEGISYYEAELEQCMPYPVENGTVVVRRVKWVPPGGAGGSSGEGSECAGAAGRAAEAAWTRRPSGVALWWSRVVGAARIVAGGSCC